MFTHSTRLIVGLLVASMAVMLANSADAQSGLVIPNLVSPRGLSTQGLHLLVAEQGGGGRILRVTEFGTTYVVASGLPSVIANTPEGPLPVGANSVIYADGYYYFTVGEAPDAGFQAVYRLREGEKPTLIADLGAYEEANNTDGDVDRTGKPELLSNPFDLVSDGAGGLYVVDSGANAIFRVSFTGQIKPFAIFPNRPNPLFPKAGGPTMDQVPTGIEIGPDGALYVSTLTGFPFPANAALVYRLKDSNADGDALDAGEATVYADGLTTATNLAFDRDGSLLVSEFSTDFLNQAPGRLVRVRNGKISEVVAAPLVSPTGLTVMLNGQIMVSQEFAGIVAEAKAGAALAAKQAPALGAPATGEAGLAEGDAGNASWLLWLAGAGGLAVLAAGAGLTLRHHRA